MLLKQAESIYFLLWTAFRHVLDCFSRTLNKFRSMLPRDLSHFLRHYSLDDMSLLYHILNASNICVISYVHVTSFGVSSVMSLLEYRHLLALLDSESSWTNESE